MKYLHVIPPSSRTMGSFVQTLETYFPEGEHLFYTTKKIASSDPLSEDPRVSTMTGSSRIEKMKHVMKAIDEVDYVFWHGFFYNERFMLFLYLFRKYLKKSVWVMWGLDLHDWKSDKSTLKARFIDHINDYVRRNIKHVVAVFPTDKEAYETTYNGDVHIAPYPINVEDFEKLEGMRQAAPRPNGKIFVQVAHNSYPFNKHLEIVEKIAPFDRENVTYYFPMNYGNEKTWAGYVEGYKADVVAGAREHFGNRAVFINKLISKPIYNDFLWNMDIAIFTARRQNGIGNIIKLLYMGNKVFMSGENPAFRYFKEQGVEVFEYESIDSMTADEFFERPSTERGRQWVVNHYHPLNAARAWDEAFSALCGHSTMLPEYAECEAVVEGNEDYCFPAKKNNLALLPYISDKIPKTCLRVFIAGDDSMAIRWAGYLRTWLPRMMPAGFLSEDKRTLGDRAIESVDIVASPAQVGALGTMGSIACATTNPFKRKVVMDLMEKKGVPIRTYESQSDSQIWPFTSIGEGCLIGPRSVVYPGSSIGKGTIIEEARIGVNCRIGDFVTLLPGCRIGDNVVIESFATVEADCIVPDGTRIKFGSHYGEGARK